MIGTVILDCDGVLMDWHGAFAKWAAMRSHIRDMIANDQRIRAVRTFSQSESFRRMQPLRGAQGGVNALRQAYPDANFVMVSACGSGLSVHHSRRDHAEMFGIRSMHLLELGESKLPWFKHYRDHDHHVGKKTLVIEDTRHIAIEANSIGCDTILMCPSCPGSCGITPTPITQVESWDAILDHIKNTYSGEVHA